MKSQRMILMILIDEKSVTKSIICYLSFSFKVLVMISFDSPKTLSTLSASPQEAKGMMRQKDESDDLPLKKFSLSSNNIVISRYEICELGACFKCNE